MCGIAGIIAADRVDRSLLDRMTDSVAHRGPDDSGAWVDDDARIGLGHRRLAIVDLSPAGHQPMQSADGRYVLTFNGEIYNHGEIRAVLERCGAVPEGGWRGRSDTEVLLQGVVTWGLAEALRHSVGMFAFGLWDRRERTLSLVRDRFGEKPLYYGWAGRDFVFGSELKVFRCHPSFEARIDRRALTAFVSRTYVPAPLSIYESVFKLEPGCILKIAAEVATSPRSEPPQFGRNDGIHVERYWSYRDVVQAGLRQPLSDEREALDQLEQALSTAIRGQSMADVPVGAFLSGGIDSSTVCALYQKYSSVPVRTFSIGFEEAAYNEAEDAKRVAAHLGTIHHERYLTVREARDVIPLLPEMYDEPFADSSQIPTHLVSKFAREQVTVALTGDGGDELFAGYHRHFVAPRMWDRLKRFPRPVRAAAGIPLGRLPSRFWDIMPGARQPHLGRKMQKALRVGGTARTFDDIYESFLDEWRFEPSPVLGEHEGPPGFDLAVEAPDVVRTMYCDAVSYLPDDILAKVDRASMAVALETRVPFLDHRVAELAARIPLALKIRDGKGKYVVRKLLSAQLPSELFERPKAGFAVPVGEWIKGPLRPWAEDLLDPRSLKADGWFDPKQIDERFSQHLSGRRDSTPALWAILMFQSWLRSQGQAAHSSDQLRRVSA